MFILRFTSWGRSIKPRSWFMATSSNKNVDPAPAPSWDLGGHPSPHTDTDRQTDRQTYMHRGRNTQTHRGDELNDGRFVLYSCLRWRSGGGGGRGAPPWAAMWTGPQKNVVISGHEASHNFGGRHIVVCRAAPLLAVVHSGQHDAYYRRVFYLGRYNNKCAVKTVVCIIIQGGPKKWYPSFNFVITSVNVHQFLPLFHC